MAEFDEDDDYEGEIDGPVFPFGDDQPPDARAASASSSSSAAAAAGGGAQLRRSGRSRQQPKSYAEDSFVKDTFAAMSAPAAASSSSSSRAAKASAPSSAQQLGAFAPKELPKLQNVVATFSCGCPLELRTIAQRTRNAEYNPKKFSAVVMRIRDPKTTALIFHTGKVVVTGARSEDFSKLAARKFCRVLQKLGFPAKFRSSQFKIQNVVAVADCGFPIRLEGLAFDHEDYASFEPELFPGLIYRLLSPKVVILIFVSGKVVLTGAKTRKQINQAFDVIFPLVQSYRKEGADPRG